MGRLTSSLLENHTGKLSCFLAGISTCLLFSIANARAFLLRRLRKLVCDAPSRPVRHDDVGDSAARGGDETRPAAVPSTCRQC